MFEALQRLAPAVLRHLLAYAELICEETGDALRQSRRRALGLAVTAAAGVMALALACVWAIAASWDGPNRLTVIGALCLGFVVVSIAGAAYYARVARLPSARAPYDRLRAEWRADMHELATLDPSFARSAHGE